MIFIYIVIYIYDLQRDEGLLMFNAIFALTCLAAQETPQGHVGHRRCFFVHGRLTFEWLSSDVMRTNGAGNYAFPCQMDWVLGYSRWYVCVGWMCRWKIWKGVMGGTLLLDNDVLGLKRDLFFSDNFQCSHVNLFAFSRLLTANVANYKMMQESVGEFSPRGLG